MHFLRRHSRQADLTFAAVARVAEAGSDGAATAELPARPTRRLRYRLSETDREAIVAGFLAGESKLALSRKWQVSAYSIRLILIEAGVAQAGLNLSERQVEEICRLYRAGVSVLEISRRTGVPDSTARMVLVERKVEAPKPGRRAPR
ncbi:hypothetical protein GCM10027070_25570 [Barrientosiimonas humi]